MAYELLCKDKNSKYIINQIIGTSNYCQRLAVWGVAAKGDVPAELNRIKLRLQSSG